MKYCSAVKMHEPQLCTSEWVNLRSETGMKEQGKKNACSVQKKANINHLLLADTYTRIW